MSLFQRHALLQPPLNHRWLTAVPRRHQADVYHAYHVLLSGGYHPDRVIVMAYDDIANNTENPLPGRVFNSPGLSTPVSAFALSRARKRETAAQ